MARALKGRKIIPNINIEEKDGISFAVNCRHCEEPLCKKACITGAITVSDGVITIEKEKCVSCYTCILSCPYGAVSPSESGAVQKCELCENSPACVNGCPNGAIVFAERSEAE
jgi:carbon-monoxide dehydrogenase iron sulfur subunit